MKGYVSNCIVAKWKEEKNGIATFSQPDSWGFEWEFLRRALINELLQC